MKKVLTVGYWSIFIFYVALLVNTVFLARDAKRSVNLVPFDMIAEQGFTLGVWGNVLMFVPVGVYVANQMKRFSCWQALGMVAGASLAIEVLQFVLARGATDIDDLMLNTAGGMIGIGIYGLCKGLFQTRERVHTAISVLSLVVGLPMVVLVGLLMWFN